MIGTEEETPKSQHLVNFQTTETKQLPFIRRRVKTHNELPFIRRKMDTHNQLLFVR